MILFTKGLGAVAAVCKEYSSPAYNQGNGVISCDGSIPKHDDGPVTLRAQMEIVPLDDLWRCGCYREFPTTFLWAREMMATRAAKATERTHALRHTVPVRDWSNMMFMFERGRARGGSVKCGYSRV